MKTKIGSIAGCLLPLIAISASLNIQDYSPLRSYGTNIFDFGPVIQDAFSIQPSDVSLKYKIEGEVLETSSIGAHIVQKRLMYAYTPTTQEYGGPSGLLSALAASKMASGTGGRIPPSHYYSLSPTMQLNFTRVIEENHVVLTNQLSAVETGQKVTIFAWPVGDRLYEDTKGKKQKIATFDFGEIVSGDLLGKSITTITTNGLVLRRVPTTEELDQKKAALVKRVVEFQRKNAEAGHASAQYDLGMRYLNGNGVEQNLSEARRWLQCAATNNYPQAAAALANITNSSALFVVPTNSVK